MLADGSSQPALVTAAEGFQTTSGRLQLFALYLPLGTAMFGASIGLAIWAWMGRFAQTPSRAATRVVASTFGALKMEEKLWP